MTTLIAKSVSHQLYRLVRDAVTDAMSYGTIGMSLSGGVDSSTIYTLTGKRVPTFTGYYEGERYDERRWSRLVNEGRERHEIKITPEDFLENFDDMVGAAQRPYQGPGTFGQYMVAKYAADQGIDVMLSGEGGDELFGGYARLLIVAGEPRPDGYDDYQLPDGYPDNLEDALQWDFDRLGDLLAVDDQMTRAFAIEAKAPFTDPRVIEFVLALPAEDRVGKKLVKEMMHGFVPPAILHRTDKRGFPTPFVEWANGPIQDFVQDRIGYTPDIQKPWDRKWWTDLCEASETK